MDITDYHKKIVNYEYKKSLAAVEWLITKYNEEIKRCSMVVNDSTAYIFFDTTK